MVIKRTGEFDLAYRFVNETNQNIFLTGKAGTGKTTFLKFLREHTLKESIVTAPTGVAAINAHGVTLHSLFQLPFGIILPDRKTFISGSDEDNKHPLLSKIRYNREKLDLLRSLELLIIDEASMVASYTVDAIDTILRHVRRNPYYPFGGVQVLFIGDLYQLPPVVKGEEWDILREYYSSIFFFDSFVLRENLPVIIELNEIFRQQDSAFIGILNGIRNNDISEENFRLLNTRLIRNFEPGNNQGYITLTTHNYQSDEINQHRLKNIPGHTHTYEAEIIDEFPENSFPAERYLKLKVGTQVMFLKNDTEGKKYFNGKIGIVSDLEDEFIKVKCKDEPKEITVKMSEWENIRYKTNPETREITEEVLGSFIQYPLRLAWAITIHKSQGLTFDRVVIDAERAFAKGQVYVALSRCTSLEGLVLKTPIHRTHLGAHQDFTDWQNSNLNKNISQLFAESRQNFALQELQNIFTWEDWYYKLNELKEFLNENIEKINPAASVWLTGLITRQKELYEVAEKFKQTILTLNEKNPSIENNDVLQIRVIDGAAYFYNEVSKWREHFLNHPLDTDTKRIAGRLDEQLSELNSILEIHLHKINCCKAGFSIETYLKNSAAYRSSKQIIRSSYSKKQGRSLQEKENTVKVTVDLFREFKSIPQVAEARNLTLGTIETHLAKAIRNNLIQIDEVIPLHEVAEIAAYFPQGMTNIRLGEIKEKVPSEIGYGKLRIVLAFMQKGNSE